MNLVADEGVDKAIVDALRAGGYGVKYFAEAGAGTGDKEILAAANDTQSLLVTCDKDFGELVFRQRLVNSGVVLIRLEGLSAATKASIVLDAINSHGSEMIGKFTVMSPGLLRIRHRDPPPPNR
jgi:predicted nuclease of predicted toxin-antitoxin system